jgi:hypothetical protein
VGEGMTEPQIETVTDMQHQDEAKARHTPGPWVVDGYSEASGTAIEQKGTGIDIATVVPRDTVSHDPHAYANARLIAAAPDLLDALLAIGVLPDGWCCCPKDRREDRHHVGECAAARAAILKAGILVDPIEGK